MARRRWVERDHPRHPGGSGEQSGRFREKVGGAGWAMRLAGQLGKGRTRSVPGPTERIMRRQGEGSDFNDPITDEEYVLDAKRRQLSTLYDELGIEERGSIEDYLATLNPDDPAFDQPLSPDDLDYALAQHLNELGEDVDAYRAFHESLPFGQYPQTREQIEDYLDSIGQPMVGGRSDLDDVSMAEGGNFGQPGRLTGEDVRQALAPERDRAVHDAYNSIVLDEAAEFLEGEEGDEDFDEDLNAQIQIAINARNRGDKEDWDFAIDHLRRMLTLGYMDEDELPPLPPGRRSGTSGV